jgi:SSS family solute:Na+ symporter
VVSLLTKPRPEEELKGLVYSMTPRVTEDHVPFIQRPLTLAVIVLVFAFVLNIIFF